MQILDMAHQSELQLACQTKNGRVVNSLIENKIDVNLRFDDGMHPLQTAIAKFENDPQSVEPVTECGVEGVVVSLLKAKANFSKACNEVEHVADALHGTPLETALANGECHLILLLLAFGQSCPSGKVNMKCENYPDCKRCCYAALEPYKRSRLANAMQLGNSTAIIYALQQPSACIGAALQEYRSTLPWDNQVLALIERNKNWRASNANAFPCVYNLIIRQITGINYKVEATRLDNGVPSILAQNTSRTAKTSHPVFSITELVQIIFSFIDRTDICIKLSAYMPKIN